MSLCLFSFRLLSFSAALTMASSPERTQSEGNDTTIIMMHFMMLAKRNCTNVARMFEKKSKTEEVNKEDASPDIESQ